MRIKLYKTRRWSDNYGMVDDIVIIAPTEVVTISHKLFDKPSYLQRDVLKLLIWWSIKRYFKLLFK
jgi:hypothetical protein